MGFNSSQLAQNAQLGPNVTPARSNSILDQVSIVDLKETEMAMQSWTWPRCTFTKVFVVRKVHEALIQTKTVNSPKMTIINIVNTLNFDINV